jgi:phosphatidate cytidylyltransferase
MDNNKPGEYSQGNVPENPIEGVRLVNRDEATAAIESGAAITRNRAADATPGGRLVSLVGYESDEPEPTWADTGDAAAPSVRIVSDTTERVSSAIRMPDSARGFDGPQAASPTVLDDEFEILDLRASAQPRPGSDPNGRDQSQGKDDGDEPVITPASSSGDASMPHWTEPATGDVPSVLGDISSTGDGHDWSLDDLGDASKLGADDRDDDLDARFAALGEVPDIRERDELIADPEPVEIPAEGESKTESKSDSKAAAEPADKHSPIDTFEEKVESLKKASIVTRSATGIVAVILAGVAFAAGPAWALTLALVVVVLAAVEYFDALRRVGYRPATALGLVAVFGAVAGTYARGEAAIPLVLALVTGFTFLWYLAGIIKDSPTANTAVTLLGVMWIGVFGSYAALLLREPNHRGLAFLGAAIILVVAYDTFAYLGGVLMGRHKLAPSVSPGKTWEGLITASIACVLVGGIVVPMIHPWGIWDGFALGIVIACAAPIGDLVESMIKRDLGLKDMGRLLPGHGGVLDRVDAILFVLPATYYLVRFLDLA